MEFLIKHSSRGVIPYLEKGELTGGELMHTWRERLRLNREDKVFVMMARLCVDELNEEDGVYILPQNFMRIQVSLTV